MNTKLPYESIDFEAYLNQYFAREDAITALPTEAELKELARKGIIKEQLVLAVQPEGTCAEAGDTLTLCTVSALPKFNNPRVTVSIGRGLYDKTLEAAVVGLQVGESCEITVQGQGVKATVLEIKRKCVPEPTDEMVVAMQVKDYQDNLITTVAQYEAFIAWEQTQSTLANINYYVMTPILEAHPIADYDEEDIRILGQLEREAFHQIFLEKQGVDLYALNKEQMREQLDCDTFDEFIEKRYEWYKMKIQQCLVYGKVLGIALEGKFDPTARYEVLSDLTELMYGRIKEELIRRGK